MPFIQGMAQLAADLSAGSALFPPLAAASVVVLGIELVLIVINLIVSLPWPAPTPAR